VQIILTRIRSKEIHYAGHFERWVDLLSELRGSGLIAKLVFHQHGALELPSIPALRVARPVLPDVFHALFADSRRYLVKSWLRSDKVCITFPSAPLRLNLLKWGGPKAAAIILQDPRGRGERLLVRWFCGFCSRNGLLSIGYSHPRFGPMSTNILGQEFPGLTLHSQERHSGLVFYLTRFSTLGIELALNGERVVFASWLGKVCAMESGTFAVADSPEKLEQICATYC
jgi:hypothetical protein